MAYDEVVIVIDPGHGGEVSEGNEASNAGAMYHDLLEKDINLITAMAFREELQKYENVRVYLTREEDVEMTLDERVDFANSVGADVMLSVHYNASADHNFFGSEIFVSAFGEMYARGYDLAQCFMNRWKEYGNTLKDIKTRIGNNGDDYYGVIRLGRQANIPTLILEHGYLDNDHDFLRINKEEAWKELGRLDAKAVADYYGLKVDVVKDKVEPIAYTEIPEDKVMPDETGPVGVRLSIDEYDSNKGDLNFTLNAYDDESKLMYYGFVLEEADEETVFPELYLWEGRNGQYKGTYHVKPGYEGPITATVFNVYQLNTNSNVCELKKSENELVHYNGEEESDDGQALPKAKPITDESIRQDEIKKAEQLKEIEEEKEEKKNSKKDIIVIGDNNSSDKAIARAIEESTYSNVKSSYYKLLLIGIIASIVFAVSVVMLISGAINKSKRGKGRTRRSYDWMDDDD